MKTLEPLPKSLRYLQPFVNFLATLPGRLDESVDHSELEAALRKRVKGLSEEAAAELLENDRDVLKSWLNDFDSTNHYPAYWVLGWLSNPDLASYLLKPIEPPPREPRIQLELPSGWNATALPFQLQ